MKLSFVPTLQVQRDLYAMPRDMARFQAYLKTMVDPRTGDLQLPLVGMNPMGKEHLPALLDALLALKADEAAAQAVQEAQSRLGGAPGDFQVTVVLSDDLKGGWTNRHFTDYGARFSTKAYLKRGWITATLWSSEPPSLGALNESLLAAIARAAHIGEHGHAETLGQMVAQEGYALNFAQVRPSLDPARLPAVKALLEARLAATDQPTLMACLYGDAIAESLGYAPLGLGDMEGFAYARASPP